MKLAHILSLAAIFTATIGCQEEKEKWTQDNRDEFVQDCRSGAKLAYEKRGIKPNEQLEKLVESICVCSGKKVEQNYTHKETLGASGDKKMQTFLIDTTKTCAAEAVDK